MDDSLLVHGAPDLKLPKPGRSAHGVLAIRGGETVLAVAECFTDDDRAARAAVEAALSHMNATGDGSPSLDRLRAAVQGADSQLRIKGQARCALALAYVAGNHALVAWTGPIRIYLVREKVITERCLETKEMIGGKPGDPSPTVQTATDRGWTLEQSDRLLLWTSGVFECVEDTLLPNLMENRPPDRCVESVLKLASYRGLGDDYAMLVAAWQDPALATHAEEFQPSIAWDDATAGDVGGREAYPESNLAVFADPDEEEEDEDSDEITAQPDSPPPAPVASPPEAGSNTLMVVGLGLVILLGLIGAAAAAFVLLS